NAITSTETIANSGERSSVRVPYFASRTSRSIQTQLQTARVCSRISVVLPKARRAAERASSADSPPSRRSSSSNSRSERSSRSRSASRFAVPFRFGHHRISALLSGRPHNACHSFRHLLPLRFLDHKLFSADFRKPVILELPVAIRRHLPFRGDQPLALRRCKAG